LDDPFGRLSGLRSLLQVCLTIFSIFSIELESSFSKRSERARSIGLDGVVCKEQSDVEDDVVSLSLAEEVVGVATS
jgi:hypothetical protein